LAAPSPSPHGLRRSSPIRLKERWWSPCELDLELAAVIFDLELDLEMNLVGHPRDEAQPVALHDDPVSGGELVRDCVQSRRCLLARQRGLLLQLYEVHRGSNLRQRKP